MLRAAGVFVLTSHCVSDMLQTERFAALGLSTLGAFGDLCVGIVIGILLVLLAIACLDVCISRKFSYTLQGLIMHQNSDQ